MPDSASMRLGMISPWWVLKIVATLCLLIKMIAAGLGSWSISIPALHMTAWPAQLLVILAGVFNLWHFRILKKSAGEIGEPGILVTTGGCFPKIRHPMYTADLFLMLGLWLLSFDLWSGILWISGVMGVVQQSRFEDRLLAQRFGGQHSSWRQTSRLLL